MPKNCVCQTNYSPQSWPPLTGLLQRLTWTFQHRDKNRAFGWQWIGQWVVRHVVEPIFTSNPGHWQSNAGAETFSTVYQFIWRNYSSHQKFIESKTEHRHLVISNRAVTLKEGNQGSTVPTEIRHWIGNLWGRWDSSKLVSCRLTKHADD